MLCYNCSKPTFKIFCSKCEKEFKQLECKRRILDDGLEVISFYKYSKIKNLLSHKHYISGYFILNKLASYSYKRFRFKNELAYAIGLDDDIKEGYSHTAILLKNMKANNIIPCYNVIKAKNRVIYKGKSLAFRKKNKRNFELLKNIDKPVILVDDIITTGETLKQAHAVLKKAKINVLFAVVLADAKV